MPLSRDAAGRTPLQRERTFVERLNVFLEAASPDTFILLLQRVELHMRSRALIAEKDRRISDAASYGTAGDAIAEAYPYLELAATPAAKLHAVFVQAERPVAAGHMRPVEIAPRLAGVDPEVERRERQAGVR